MKNVIFETLNEKEGIYLVKVVNENVKSITVDSVGVGLKKAKTEGIVCDRFSEIKLHVVLPREEGDTIDKYEIRVYRQDNFKVISPLDRVRIVVELNQDLRKELNGNVITIDEDSIFVKDSNNKLLHEYNVVDLRHLEYHEDGKKYSYSIMKIEEATAILRELELIKH